MLKKLTNIQILKKAIDKAVDGGYNEFGSGARDILDEEDLKQFKNLYYLIIFSHDFAESFWGEHPDIDNGKKYDAKIKINGKIYWQYHLQQMILKEKPLKYIKKFL